MKILCMGDSITYGHGLTDLSQRWSDRVAACTGHTLINCGVSGDTTGGNINSLSRLLNAVEDGAVKVGVAYDGDTETISYIYVTK